MAYTQIKQEDFESVLSEIGQWRIITQNGVKETIYEMDNIRIYSSLENGISRDVDKDAIRVIVWDALSNFPYKPSEARVYRVEGWRKNLKDRILKTKSEILTYPKCKRCGAFLIERENRQTKQKFMGCMNWKNCKNHTVTVIRRNNVVDLGQVENPIEPSIKALNTHIIKQHPQTSVTTKKREWNSYQQEVFSFISNQTGHCVVEAVAGSGKTTTIVESLNIIPQHLSVLFIAFNRHIVQELRTRAPGNVDVATFHSVGFRSCISQFGNIRVDNNKQRQIIDNILLEKDMMVIINGSIDQIDNNTIKDLKNTAHKLCSHIKAGLCEVNQSSIGHIIDWYGIETTIPLDILTIVTKKSIEQSRTITSVVNFDDQCYLPIALNLPLKKYDLVFIDELQDTNKNQIELALGSLKPNGRIIGVGDRHQSLYGFRGADTEAIPSIIKRLNATELPLSITYRCPKKIVELAKEFVPAIESSETAIDGIVEKIEYDDFYDAVKEGDMVICRYNAPLIEPVFELLSRGIKAAIKGHDIGEGLITLVKKLKSKSIDDFFVKLDNWFNTEIKKAEALDKNTELIHDKYEVLQVLSSECDSVDCIIRKIQQIFSDEKQAVTFSSIHRAKGLEADRVFILKYSNMPSKYAKKDWEIAQEKNCQYVSLTRTKNTLYFVE